MNFRVVLWQSAIFIVLGIGYNKRFDPPDVFYAVPLKDSLVKSIITNLELTEIPFHEATEITDKSVIKAIWILYGK